jgi:hypothetical protein
MESRNVYKDILSLITKIKLEQMAFKAMFATPKVTQNL